VTSIYFVHDNPDDDVARLLRLQTASGVSVRATSKHFLYVRAGGCDKQRDSGWDVSTRAVTADAVQLGDGLWVVAAPGGLVKCSEVVSVSRVTVVGTRNPQTLEGTLVVDGVAASTHVAWSFESALYPDTAMKYLPAAHHALTWVPRALWQLNRELLPRVMQPEALRIGRNVFLHAKAAGEALVASVSRTAVLLPRPSQLFMYSADDSIPVAKTEASAASFRSSESTDL